MLKNTDQTSIDIEPLTDTVLYSFTIPSDGIYYIVASITATTKEDGKYLIFHMTEINPSTLAKTWSPIEICDTGSLTRMVGSCIKPYDEGTILKLEARTSNSNTLQTKYRFSIVKLV